MEETTESPETPAEITTDSLNDILLTDVTEPEPDIVTSSPLQTEPSVTDSPLPRGSAWDTGETPSRETAPREPEEPAKPETSLTFDPAALTPEQIKAVYEHVTQVPEGKTLFPEDPKQADSWEGLRTKYQESQREIQELRAKVESAPQGNPEELAKLRAEYEAIDRIRNSEAYKQEVMGKQAELLNQAQELGNYANLEPETVEDLFNADNPYSAEQRLQDLNDPAAANQLRPLVMDALAARRQGEAALKSETPVEELKKWQARSMELQSQQNQLMAQQEAQLDRVALENAFTERIATTPIGQTDFMRQVAAKVGSDIDNQTPVSRDDLYEAMIWKEAVPFLIAKMAQDAQEVGKLRSDLSRVAPTPQNQPSVNPLPQRSGVRPGGVAPGSAWSVGD